MSVIINRRYFLMLEYLKWLYFKWLYCLGHTPLLNAASSGKIEIVKLLVSKGSSLEEKSKTSEFYSDSKLDRIVLE